MFSQWHDEDELFKFISSTPNCQKQTRQQNKVAIAPSSLCNNDVLSTTNIKPKKQGRRRKASTAFDNIEESPTDYLKKAIHRDVERQRRQEMSSLYQSMRSLIPPPYLEGKRSISDHINGTVRYIRHMQKRMDELQSNRDKQKELLNSKSFKVASEYSQSCEQTNIKIQTCRAGMEVTVSTALKGGLPLSRVLNFLVREGMSIRSCISTSVHERLLHVIESEVNEERSINQNELRQKLMYLEFSL